MWSPRTGLTDIFDDWKHETLMLLAGLGFNTLEELLAWLPPTKIQIAQPQGANARTTRTQHELWVVQLLPVTDHDE